LDQTDVRLLRELERGLPLVPAPFDEIGKRLDLDGDQVIERVRNLKEAGIIRKFRARIDQRKGGSLQMPSWRGKPGLEAVIPEHCWHHFPQ